MSGAKWCWNGYIGPFQTRGCGKTVRSELEGPNVGAKSWRLLSIGTTKGTKKGLQEVTGKKATQAW